MSAIVDSVVPHTAVIRDFEQILEVKEQEAQTEEGVGA